MEIASFLAVAIAHEFNNLHGGIQGHAEIALSTKDLPEEVRECLEVILKTLQKAESITAQLDKFSREIPPHKMPCSLSSVVDDAVALVRREFEGDGIQIGVRSDPGIPDLVIDDAQIGQVMLNLFINARDAMAGRRTKILTIETGRRGKRAFIRVSDTGSGIEFENSERIFEPFFTTKGDTDGKSAHGLGLGLTVSKTIVEEHHGEIKVSSRKGRGTTFTIWLPRDQGMPDQGTIGRGTRRPRAARRSRVKRHATA